MLRPIAARSREFVPPRFRRKRLEVFYEVYVAAGIVDVLVALLDSRELRRRERFGLSPIAEYASAAVLNVLTDRSMTTADISTITSISRDHLHRYVLPRLVEGGYIHRRSDCWEAVRSIRPVVSGLVAIEVKRTAFVRAVSQALRYRRFANAVFVVMPDSVASRTPQRHHTVQRVGLAFLKPGTGELSIVRKPKWRRPLSEAEFFLAGERIWTLMLAGARSGPVAEVFGSLHLASEGSDPRVASAEEHSHPLGSRPRPRIPLKRA